MEDTDRIRRTLKLIQASNRACELLNDDHTYTKRNKSGVQTHALFIQPFQWEDNRDSWFKEEVESVNNHYSGGKMKPLGFLRKLMALTGMIKHGEFFEQGDTYPFEIKNGDIIKIAIISHSYPPYPEFDKNDGCFVICKKSLSEFDLDVFPLHYGFDLTGTIQKQIKFNGIDIFPDAYVGVLEEGGVCHSDNQLSNLCIDNISPELVNFKEHPIPLYKDDPESTHYGFLLSEFEFCEFKYKFVLPFNLSLKEKTEDIVKKCMRNRMRDSNGFTCELISFDGKQYVIYIHDYILVKGSGVYRDEIYQNVWEYFRNELRGEQHPNRLEVAAWFKSLKAVGDFEKRLSKACCKFGVKATSLDSLTRDFLRKSQDIETPLQFVLDLDICTKTYTSPQPGHNSPTPQPWSPAPEIYS